VTLSATSGIPAIHDCSPHKSDHLIGSNDMDSTPERSELASPSPYDTPWSSGTRFGMELAAWVLGPWAAGDLFGSPWAALPTLLILLALPSVFNTPGDKKVTGIATPGPARIVIEMLLLAVAIIGAWIVWPVWAAVLVVILAGATVTTGMPRYRWLAAQTASARADGNTGK